MAAGCPGFACQLSSCTAPTTLLRPARPAKAISGARLVIMPGVGHYLPAEVYPQVADEVRALADRAATAPSQASTA